TRGTVDGNYANVTEQSGLVAGDGGYHVAVGGNVDLKGGVIASTSSADQNFLSADSLTYSDIDNASSATTSNLGVAIGAGGLPTPIIGQPAQEGDSGVAHATVTPGTLNLANQSQDLAALNTDLSLANTQATIFDIDALKAKQQ